MKLICKYSGVGFELATFQTLKAYNFIHPAIQYANKALLSSEYSKLENIQNLSDAELRLCLAARILSAKSIEFNSALTVPATKLQETYITCLPTLAWLSNLSDVARETIPGFLISEDTSDLDSFVSGYIPEVADIRKNRIQKDRDLSLSKVIAWLDAGVQRRIAMGKPPLSGPHLSYIYENLKVPVCDREFYTFTIFGPLSKVVVANENPVVNLLELDESIEDWYSTSLAKLYFKRAVAARLQALLDFGLSLPSSYWEIDPETGEQIPVFKTATVSKLLKAGKFSIVSATAKAKEFLLPKPERSNFATTLDYARALSAWHQGKTFNN